MGGWIGISPYCEIEIPKDFLIPVTKVRANNGMGKGYSTLIPILPNQTCPWDSVGGPDIKRS